MECVEFGRVDIQPLSDDELADLVGGIAVVLSDPCLSRQE
jgi:hypothetical protein